MTARSPQEPQELQAEPPRPEGGSAREVFAAFLKLGLTSFGGPIAHLGYFREELVTRRGWLSDHAYADLVALCQFLPGPASSQVGFALGLMRAGWLGALAAFTAFTLPSALILLAFALSAAAWGGPLGTGALHGLKIVAVAIVAQAVWGMAKSLCPDRERAAVAVGAVAVLAVLPGAAGMMGAIVLGGLAGLALRRGSDRPVGGHVALPVTRAQACAALALFAGLLVLLPLLAGQSQALAVIDGFYRAGALVFGGGHVVLPLLQAETVAPGWVTEDAFLAGYGAAQAVPGPLFTFAAFLGAVAEPFGGPAGAAVALVGIFLPSLFLVLGVMPFWEDLRRAALARRMLAGVNAAVVGLLAAAFHDPVFTRGVGSAEALVLAIAAFVALRQWAVSPWIVVILSGAAGSAIL